MKFLAVLIFSFSLTSCATDQVIQRTPEPRQRVQRLERPPRISIPQLPSKDLFALGQKNFSAKDFFKATDYFEAAAMNSKGAAIEKPSFLWMLRSLASTNRFHETEELAGRLLAGFNWSPAELKELFSIRVRSLESSQNYLAAVRSCYEAASSQSLGEGRDAFLIKGQELIESKLSPQELADLVSTSPLPRFKAVAAFRLGELYLDAKDLDRAKSYFGLTASLDKESEWGYQAQDILSQLEALRRVDSRTVGAVLPLSGRHASQGQRVLRGLQLGLGLYEKQRSSFRLAVVDSEGNPDHARRGVERLVKEDNVVAIIGSVLSKNADTVASKTSEFGVPNLSLSQKAGVTDVGPTVFRNAMTSEMQVRLLVKTAMEKLEMKRFAILFPNDAYGVEFTNIFWDEVLARGGEIVAAQPYSTSETDFRAPIQKLVGTYYVDDREEEYRARLAEWAKTQKIRTARVRPPDDLLPPIVDFDGLFIPDSVKSLGQIAAMLSYNGVRDIRLLGTQLWNIPSLSRRAGSFSDSLLFVDSFVSTDINYKKSQFVREYKRIFSEEPGVLEAQAYDSALLLRQLISQGYSSRDSLTKALERLSGFPGALGPLTTSDQREIQRPLVALTLKSGTIQPFETTSSP